MSAFSPFRTIGRRLGGLAVATVLLTIGLVPAAPAASTNPPTGAPTEARIEPPLTYMATVLTSSSGEPFAVSGIGNPVNRGGLVAGHTLGSPSRAAVLNLKTRSMQVLNEIQADVVAFAVDVNAAGEVVGQTSAPGGAFFWSTRTGRVTMLTAPRGSAASVHAINDHGTAVGSVGPGGVTPRGVVWNTQTGRRQTLPMAEGLAINNRGVVAGYRVEQLNGDPRLRPVVWTPATSKLKVLNPLAADDSARPTDINSAGTVVGNSYSLVRDDTIMRPVLWTRGRAAPCRLPISASPSSTAAAINDRGQVVGLRESAATHRDRPALWKGCGGSRQILPYDAEKFAEATGINSRGQIVGSSREDGSLLWTVTATPLITRSGKPFAVSRTGNPVNERGLVAGHTVGDEPRAAVFNLKTRSMRVLAAFPGATTTTATDVNEGGLVIGQVLFPGGPSRAFLWSTRTGRVTMLPAPGNVGSVANAINDRGTAVGQIATIGAVAWNTRTGSRHRLDMDEAVGINDKGVIVGYRTKDLHVTPRVWPVIWTPGTSRLTTLDPLAGDEIATPADINNAGAVVGISWSLIRDDTFVRPVLWKPGRAAPCRLPETGVESFATAINDRGQIVGTEEAAIGSAGRQRPMVWNGCGNPAQILPFGPDDIGAPTGINNHGQIVGVASWTTRKTEGLTWTLSQT
jgi:uncharacterized membrane protein